MRETKVASNIHAKKKKKKKDFGRFPVVIIPHVRSILFINRRNSGKEGNWPPNFRSFHRQSRPGPQDVPGIQELSTTRHERKKLILKNRTGN